ncbi:TPA: hypothetical protein HMT66_19645 [Escherichia coli]|nr:hypothetical protein [Escherichia coli]
MNYENFVVFTFKNVTPLYTGFYESLVKHSLMPARCCAHQFSHIVLVQNTVLLVQCWFNKKNKILIKQYSLQIEPTEPTEPTPFLRT